MNLDVRGCEVLALIGPSGCGKSTFLRSLNRMNDTVAGATVSGRVELDGSSIYGPDIDPVLVRQRVGMVFQRSNPFPKSIFENVAYALRVAGVHEPRVVAERVEIALRQADLWNEVKDRLDESGPGLSGGQQQRLCIARALAVGPEVLLMDEPASALDPISTAKVEDLISELKKRLTIVIVTHSMQQAARISTAHGLLSHGAPGRGGRHDDDLHAARPARDRGLHHGPVWLMQAHTSRDFESELRELRAQTLAMGARCERALQLALRAFWEGSVEFAAEVEALGRTIDQDEMDIDALALRILALRQPVAYDLRLLTSVTRLATDLERIGDESVNIAERARGESSSAKQRAEGDLRTMAERAQQLLREALEAFASNEDERADWVLVRDKTVDGLHGSIVTAMSRFISEDAKHVGEALRVIQVSKYLERVADHATNIAEQVIFIVRAEDVRHKGLQ